MALLPAAAFVGLACVVVALAAHFVRACLKFRAMEVALPGPPSLPVLGNALHFLGCGRGDVMQRVLGLWGGRKGLTRISLFNRLLVIVSDPVDLEQATRRKDFVDKSKLFYEDALIVFKSGLGVMNGPKWKAHRRALQPGLHKELLDQFVAYFNEESLGFVKRVVPYEAVDPLEALYRSSGQSFFRSMLCELDQEVEDVIVKALSFSHSLLTALIYRALNPLLWPNFIFSRTSGYKGLMRLKDQIYKVTHTIIDRKRTVLEAQKAASDNVYLADRKTIVDILLSSDEGQYCMSDEEIVDEVAFFFGAAVETSVSSMHIVLKILSLRPDLQDKIIAEVDEVLGTSGRDITHDDLPKLVYTECVIKESMRMYPPVPFGGRQVYADTEFAGHQLPAGTTLLLNFFGAQRDPDHWENPDKFDPERFRPEISEGRHPCAFMAFSAGPRNCIGNAYAVRSMKTFLANIMRAHSLHAVDDGITDVANIPLSVDITLRVLGGCKVKFVPRK